MRSITVGMPVPVVVGLALAGFVLSAPRGVAGQVRVLGSTVTDQSDAPIEGVAVTLVDPSREEDLAQRFTDVDGRFVFVVDEDVTTIQLRAERIGYATALAPPIDLEGYSSLTVEIRLSPEAVPVAPLEVIAGQRRETSFMHDGFHHRKERGMGQYITREDIERRGPSDVTELLRTIPGVRLTSSGIGSNGVVTMGRGSNTPLGTCPAQVYVDNFHVNKASGWHFRINDLVAPGDVAGIEVYKGLATVPAEFLSPKADCGVVVIWTQRSAG